MKRNLCIFISFILINTLFSQTYINNVTIADVENQKMIHNQTVVITNDLISNIQPSKKWIKIQDLLEDLFLEIIQYYLHN